MLDGNFAFDFDDEFLTNSFTTSPNKSPQKQLLTEPKSTKPNGNLFKKPIAMAESRKGVKRKFPGPAGILPDYRNANITILENRDQTKRVDQEEEIPCSQNTMSIFTDGPWQKMTEDFKLNSTTTNLLNKYNIKWIKTKAALNQLINQKAPFLAAIIQSIECYEGNIPIINVTLKDMTGEIQGTIIHHLYEEYLNELTIGSVIVLKQFGVLTTGSNNSHYLTITANNLITIYTNNSSSSNSKPHNENISDLMNLTQQQNGVNKIILQSFSFDELIGEQKPQQQQQRRRQQYQSNTDHLLKSQVVKRKFSFIPKPQIQLENNSNIFDTSCDDLNLSLDNLESNKNIVKSNKIMVNCSQLSIATDTVENSEIWQNVFDGIDTNSLFEDF